MKYRSLIFMLVLSGCAVGDDDETVIEDRTLTPELSWGAGAVSVEYRPSEGESARVHAHFLSAKNLDRDAAFEALEIWVPNDELDQDVCSISNVSDSQTGEPTLRLLGANEISLTLDGEDFTLTQRRLPDAVSGISGVVYGNDEGFDHDEIEIPFTPGSTYVVRAQGSNELPGFAVELVAPEPLVLNTISGQIIDEERHVVLANDDDLALTWVVSDPNGMLFLELSGDQTMTCRLTNDGQFFVPAHLVETLGPQITATLRTARVETLNLEPLGPVQFIIGTADDISIAVE